MGPNRGPHATAKEHPLFDRLLEEPAGNPEPLSCADQFDPAGVSGMDSHNDCIAAPLDEQAVCRERTGAARAERLPDDAPRGGASPGDVVRGDVADDGDPRIAFKQ